MQAGPLPGRSGRPGSTSPSRPCSCPRLRHGRWPPAAPVWENLPLARSSRSRGGCSARALAMGGVVGGAALFIIPTRPRTAAMLRLLCPDTAQRGAVILLRPFADVAEPTLADIARDELTGGAATASANEYLPAWVADPDPPTDLAEALRAQPGRSIRSTAPRPAAGQHSRAIGRRPAGRRLPARSVGRYPPSASGASTFPVGAATLDGLRLAIGTEHTVRFHRGQPCRPAPMSCGSSSPPRRRARLAARSAGVVGAIGMFWVGHRSRRGDVPANGSKRDQRVLAAIGTHPGLATLPHRPPVVFRDRLDTRWCPSGRRSRRPPPCSIRACAFFAMSIAADPGNDPGERRRRLPGRCGRRAPSIGGRRSHRARAALPAPRRHHRRRDAGQPDQGASRRQTQQRLAARLLRSGRLSPVVADGHAAADQAACRVAR